jgi:hypothetical protein
LPGAGDVQTESILAEFEAKPADRKLAVEGWFDQLWAMYWRKVGRDTARKAFITRVRTEGDWRRIEAAVIAQTPEMLARESRFRPHAATWLHQGRMFDEESPAPQGARPTEMDRNQRRREETNQIAKVLRQK